MTSRQKAEIILRIIIVFLSALLVLGILNGGITLYMIVGALGATYIFVHYWRRRVVALQQKKVQVK